MSERPKTRLEALTIFNEWLAKQEEEPRRILTMHGHESRLHDIALGELRAICSVKEAFELLVWKWRNEP